MQRRDALRLLVTGAVLPTLTPEVFAFFREAHPAEGYALRTLNPHQNATVVAMIDLVLPATDTPGAKGARVNEFIDLILTEWATLKREQLSRRARRSRQAEQRTLREKVCRTRPPAQQEAQLRAIDESDGQTPAATRATETLCPKWMRIKGAFW